MSTNTAVRSARVAGTIGGVKWVLVGLMLLAAAVGMLAALVSGEPQALGIGLAVAFVSVIYAVGIWVLFGWFELTLRALGEIAQNTAPVPYPPQTWPEHTPQQPGY